MKQHINKVLYFLMAILLLMGVSCEKDTNGPLPDEGMRDAAVAYVTFQETSDQLVDLVNPDAFNLDYTVGTLWDPKFQKIQVVVVFNREYTKQYIVADNITSVPASGSITMADMVAAIDELGSSADIKEGDSFHFFCNTTLPDGSVTKMYEKIGDKQGVLMIGSGLVQSLAAVEGVALPDINIPVPCAFNLSDYLGTLSCVEDWGGGDVYNYTVEVIEGTTEGSIINLTIIGIFGGMGLTESQFQINLKNLNVTAEEQMILEDITQIGYPAFYGSLFLGSTLGVVNTCALQLEFTVSQWCVSIGCFGGSPKYTLKK